MVLCWRYIKMIAKVTAIIIVLFTFSSLFNGNIIRPKVLRFQMWKMNYDPFNFKKRFRLTDMKYILLWTPRDPLWSDLRFKQLSFKQNKCRYDNCYITEDKNLLGGDYRNFDAVIISEKNILKLVQLPERRHPKQLYIYAARESADNYPICDKKFDNYFNLTWTYKLDSDAVWPYFIVKNKYGEVVGPRSVMLWSETSDTVEGSIKEIVEKKTSAAVWFVSNCYTRSRREDLFYDLKQELDEKYNFHVETVGSCGSKECLRENDEECIKNLYKYHFYLAFENSKSPDYVTEKVLRAVTHYTVPVVFGGANYTRFLPPNSYIDASKVAAHRTAGLMAYLIRNHSAYLEYFRWHSHYHYEPSTKSICGLCQIVNRRMEYESKTYKKFRAWWHPGFRKACRNRKKMLLKANGTEPDSSSCSEDHVIVRKLIRDFKTDFLKVAQKVRVKGKVMIGK